MAYAIGLMSEPDCVFREIFQLYWVADREKIVEYTAALRIQAWFRGIQSRKYLKHLHSTATIIQKCWRGFLGRKLYVRRLRQMLDDALDDYFNNSAAQIQKIWRGYRVRRFVFSYYKEKENLKSIMQKNSEIQEQMVEYRKQIDEKKIRDIEEDEENAAIYWARKHHYLVSTRQIDGVFRKRNDDSSPHQRVEELLKVSRPLSHRKERPLPELSDQTCRPYELSKIYEFCSPKHPLPPIKLDKPQGPFRDPIDVYQQRFKPLQPSLRVATDYFSLNKAREDMRAQEWTKRICDERFKPFTQKTWDTQYKAELHSKSDYNCLPYGTKQFRDCNPERYITGADFKLVVPPIPQFAKLNDTYSSGQEV